MENDCEPFQYSFRVLLFACPLCQSAHLIASQLHRASLQRHPRRVVPHRFFACLLKRATRPFYFCVVPQHFSLLSPQFLPAFVPETTPL